MRIHKVLLVFILFFVVTTALLIGTYLNGLPVLSYGYEGFIVKSLIIIIGMLIQIVVLMVWPDEIE